MAKTSRRPRLRLARERAGLTQLQAAAKLGCNPSTVSRKETGEDVSVAWLKKAAKVYGVRWQELVDA